ncbi:oligosaccharide flippase family protein [Clostridium sp. AM58-1XD]|uniref:oligosaccharide flippase family protein n=1 Tax=Clostridium sp. AM58-1XD TaxID=2292307 RepID=UPI00268E83C1
MNLSPQKRAFLAGTLLLTSTGFLCRILGFFYRIFLSRTIGAEGLGLYNMVHPVFGICFALCAGSIQTAISQSVAAHMKKGKSIFLAGLVISLSMSAVLAALIWHLSDFLAARVLLEERCAPLLPFIAVSVPCSAVHACINGYYYGMQKTKVPAFSQLAEQIVRIGAVFLLADIMTEKGIVITVQLAVMGHLIGEAASSLYTILSICLFSPKRCRLPAMTAVRSDPPFHPSFLKRRPLL